MPRKKASEAPTEAVPSTSLKLSRPVESVPVYYTNQAMVSTSNLDVKIAHCQVVKADASGTETNPQAVVYMTVDHARRLAQLLFDQIAKFDEARAKEKPST